MKGMGSDVLNHGYDMTEPETEIGKENEIDSNEGSGFG